MILVYAIHGILTWQTTASWPDKLDAWLYLKDPRIKTLKKEYNAGPFPKWNCLVKDPAIARGAVAEIEQFVAHKPDGCDIAPPTWIVAHSNGAVIALQMMRQLAERGYPVAGMILTGAACVADINRNNIWTWVAKHQLGKAIAYSSQRDGVVNSGGIFGWLKWPYGGLGRTGWMIGRSPWKDTPRIFTRWFEGGHSGYFAPNQMEATFAAIYGDICSPSIC